MNYIPGLHILCEITTSESSKISEFQSAQNFLRERIRHYELNIIGEVFHDFPGGGYTGVICLTESHISIHTWPEHNFLTLDVFLSNYKKVNDDTARNLLDDILSFFKAENYEKREVRR
ncbi:MAG: adenosylmethionine decarboxylase [Cytophagaceae bacterium]